MISSYRTLPRAMLENIFLVSHILLLFHWPKGSWNNLQDLRNLENISDIGIWKPIFVTSFLNDVKCSNAKVSEFMNEVLVEFNMFGKAKKDGKTKAALQRKEYATQSW